MLVMGLAVAVSISEYVRLNKSSRSQTPLIMDGDWLIETCATDRLNAKSRTEAEAATAGAGRIGLGAARRSRKWADVDLDRRTITIRKTKEGKARVLRINADLAGVLAALPSRDKNGPVFLDETGAPAQPDRVYRRFKEAAIRAKVPNADKLRLHDLRHAFGTSLSERSTGATETAIIALTGHSNLSMTQRYVHAREARLQEAVEKLSGIQQAYIPVPGPTTRTVN
jgi:site-specific recombinase XerC